MLAWNGLQELGIGGNYFTGPVPPFLNPGISMYDIRSCNFSYAQALKQNPVKAVCRGCQTHLTAICYAC